MTVEIHVPGIPRPGGSKRHIGRGILIDAGKHTKEWRAVVSLAGRGAMRSAEPMDGPLDVAVVFYMPRPKSHYKTGKNAGQLKPDAPQYHTSKPDATKLWRSTEDALTGIAWRDDAQIAIQIVTKVYGDKPGADIIIGQLNSQRAEGMEPDKENHLIRAMKAGWPTLKIDVEDLEMTEAQRKAWGLEP